jgi:hypothetical protein
VVVSPEEPQVDVEGFGLLCRWETTLVPGGEGCTIPVWDQPGEHVITVFFDPRNVVPEADTGHNVMTWKAVVE